MACLSCLAVNNRQSNRGFGRKEDLSRRGHRIVKIQDVNFRAPAACNSSLTILRMLRDGAR